MPPSDVYAREPMSTALEPLSMAPSDVYAREPLSTLAPALPTFPPIAGAAGGAAASFPSPFPFPVSAMVVARPLHSALDSSAVVSSHVIQLLIKIRVALPGGSISIDLRQLLYSYGSPSSLELHAPCSSATPLYLSQSREASVELRYLQCTPVILAPIGITERCLPGMDRPARGPRPADIACTDSRYGSWYICIEPGSHIRGALFLTGQQSDRC